MKKQDEDFFIGIQTIRPFVSNMQIRVLCSIYRTEESVYAQEIVKMISEIIEKMPSSYETEEIDEPDKVVWLHYFYGYCDWYIVEKDKGNEVDDKEAGLEVGGQYQAFGYANLGDVENAEWGYISIVDLLASDVELDFNFIPKPFKELKLKG